MTLDLTTYSLVRPTKIEWLLPSLPPDPITMIKSKGTRKFLRNSVDRYLAELQLTVVQKEITLDDYLQWLPYYTAKMTENNFEIFANADWYAVKKSEQARMYGIFVYSEKTMVGSAIISQTLDNRFTIHFKASDKLRDISVSNASLGTYIEYLYWQLAYQHSAVAISSGTSRNAFGVIHHLGYLNFKTRFGYLPVVSAKSENGTTVDVLPNQPVCFYATNTLEANQSLQLYVYNHGNKIDQETQDILCYTAFQQLN